MKDLRRRFERFCLKNRGKGIPNLMLVIAIGNLAVLCALVIDPSNIVYSYLCFSRSAILRGQVWRLFSYIFTYLIDVAAGTASGGRVAVLLLSVRQDPGELLGHVPLQPLLSHRACADRSGRAAARLRSVTRPR